MVQKPTGHGETLGYGIHDDLRVEGLSVKGILTQEVYGVIGCAHDRSYRVFGVKLPCMRIQTRLRFWGTRWFTTIP